MPFVNEYIPPEDVTKYHIEEINKKVHLGFNHSRQWTIDRERDIYFREVGRGREEFFYVTTNTFYWKGRLTWVTLEGLSRKDAQQADGDRFGYDEPTDPRSSFLIFKVLRWSEGDLSALSPELKARRVEVILSLKQALEASKGGVGVYTAHPDRPCHVTLIVGRGVS